jgi:hypothetical protein
MSDRAEDRIKFSIVPGANQATLTVLQTVHLSAVTVFSIDWKKKAEWRGIEGNSVRWHHDWAPGVHTAAATDGDRKWRAGIVVQ